MAGWLANAPEHPTTQNAHARCLAFYLLSKRPLSASDTNNAKSLVKSKSEEVKINMDFLKEIKKDQQMQQELVEKDSLSDSPSETMRKSKTLEFRRSFLKKII